MREVPTAADVVLAGLLESATGTARVVVATPLAAYARCHGGLVGVLAPAAVRVPGSVVAPAPLVAVLRPGDEVLVGGGCVDVPDRVVAGRVVAPGVRLLVRRWWDSAVPRLPAVPGVPARVLLATSAGVPDAVRAGARALLRALDGEGGLRDAVRALVGLGPGLTPAGDDVVAGVLVALVAAGDHDRAGSVLDAVRPCLHRTSVLSAALLEHAGAGRAVPRLARFLQAPADPGVLAALLAVGGSSGAALALGAGIGLSVRTARMATPADREVA